VSELTESIKAQVVTFSDGDRFTFGPGRKETVTIVSLWGHWPDVLIERASGAQEVVKIARLKDKVE
jgi:hypothetical protein